MRNNKRNALAVSGGARVAANHCTFGLSSKCNGVMAVSAATAVRLQRCTVEGNNCSGVAALLVRPLNPHSPTPVPESLQQMNTQRNRISHRQPKFFQARRFLCICFYRNNSRHRLTAAVRAWLRPGGLANRTPHLNHRTTVTTIFPTKSATRGTGVCASCMVCHR